MAPAAKLKSLSCTTLSGSKICFTPRPSQPEQAPTGLLKENKRGSNSDTLYPQIAQAKLAEKVCSGISFPSMGATEAKPSARRSAVPNDSDKRKRKSVLTFILSTTTSILCFFLG